MALTAGLGGILIGGALTAESVRRWVASAFDHSATTGKARAYPVPAAGHSPVAVDVEFVPQRNELEIVLAETQAAGTLRVTFEERSAVEGRILTPDSGATLMVTPAGFRVPNEGARTWSYVFRVPQAVERTRVIVGGDLLAELAPTVSDTTLRLSPPLP